MLLTRMIANLFDNMTAFKLTTLYFEPLNNILTIKG